MIFRQKVKYRITKYNPKLRDSRGAYTQEDWTAYCDIGHVYGDVIFTSEEYLRVESNYISAILQAVDSLKADALYIRKLESLSTVEKERDLLEKYGLQLSSEEEKVFCDLRDGKEVSKPELPAYLRLLLRECFWCELHTKRSTVVIYPGYDYYVYLHCDSLDEGIITASAKQGIYIELLEDTQTVFLPST